MKKTDLIYLASPYTHTSHRVKVRRFKAVCAISAYLMNKGYHVFCPIAMSHPIAQIGGADTSWAYWKEYDTKILERCDCILVCDNLSGWDRSVGVSEEIKIAEGLGLPVYYFSKLEI